MKKYVLGLFLTIFAICFFASTSFADEVQRPAVYVYNEKLTSDIIVAYGGTTMAPFREIFEKYNMNVQWDSKTKSVTATSKDRLTTIKLAEDDMYGYVNDKKVKLTQTPFQFDGVLYVNLRFISESLGAHVEYIKKPLSVYITFPDAEKSDK